MKNTEFSEMFLFNKSKCENLGNTYLYVIRLTENSINIVIEYFLYIIYIILILSTKIRL